MSFSTRSDERIDNFSPFHLRFVRNAPSGVEDYWTNSVGEGEKNDWRGFAFERIGLAHVEQIKMALGIADVRTEVFSWKCSASADLRGAQIDLLALRGTLAPMKLPPIEICHGIFCPIHAIEPVAKPL